MTLLHQAAQKAVAVPLVEQLRSIPSDAKLRIDTPNALGCMDTCSIPVGRLCHEAASALQQQPEPVAWYWEHVMQSSHGIIEAGFSGTPVEVTDDAMWNGKVATIVTELHAGRRLLPPKIAADMGLPTELPALQQQEVPREPVARQDHRELMLLAAADLESWMKSYHRDGATEATVKRLRDAAIAASPSTTQQQEAGNGQKSAHLMRWCQSLIAALKRLSFAAQTSGGTAGPDAELQAAIAQAEAAMSLRALLDAVPSTPESAEKDDAGGGKGVDRG